MNQMWLLFKMGRSGLKGRKGKARKSWVDFSIHRAYDYSQIRLKIWVEGISLEAQWLRLHSSSVGGTGLISDQGTKIPCSVWHHRNFFLKKLKKNLCSDQAQWSTCWGAGSLVHCYSHNNAWVMSVLGSCACLRCPVWMLLENRWNHAEFVNGRCQVIWP